MNDYLHASLGAREVLLVLMERKLVATLRAYVALDVHVILGAYGTGSFQHRDKIDLIDDALRSQSISLVFCDFRIDGYRIP